MKRLVEATVLLVALNFSARAAAQDTLRVIAYRVVPHATTTTISGGTTYTSCYGQGDVRMWGESYGTFDANLNCTSYTDPPTRITWRTADVYIYAETSAQRLVMTCRANWRWSQCRWAVPGDIFRFSREGGNIVIEYLDEHRKEKHVKYALIQAADRPAPEQAQVTRTAAAEARPTIEAPSTTDNSGFASRWKSLTSGTVYVLRFEGDYIYSERIVPEDAAKAGVFFLTEFKKDGDKYTGKTNGRVVSSDRGASCSVGGPVELTLVTKDRIEGRSLSPPPNAKINWRTCSYAPPAEWRPFTLIPVR
jgi:hypothetical protein